MNKLFLSLLALPALIAPCVASDGWETDFEIALEKAQEKSLPIIVDFNGSDWCPPCKMLKKEVFESEAFKAYAKDKFILLDVDVPKGTDKLTEEEIAINKEFCKLFKISGFPTVFVMNEYGVVMGGFVGGRSDVDAVTAIIDEAVALIPTVAKEMDKYEKVKTKEEEMAAIDAIYAIVPEAFHAHNPFLEALKNTDSATEEE